MPDYINMKLCPEYRDGERLQTLPVGKDSLVPNL